MARAKKAPRKPTKMATKSAGLNFRTMLKFVVQMAAEYIKRPVEERSDEETHAALLVGLTGAMLREGNAEGLRRVVFAVSDLRLASAKVVRLSDWKASRPRRPQ